jgi:probable H4MPT-linked C1 transfer pathway protein
VRAILDACAGALGSREFLVFNLEGKLVPFAQAAERPLSVAAANWVATSLLAARWWAARGDRRAALLIDVGSTTTDIIPLRDGRPDPAARADADRLLSGELVYSGLLRTPPSSFTDVAPLGGSWCRLAAEQFAITADVHRVLDRIADDEYTVPTPDGRGKGREDAEARLARLICSDRESLGLEVIRGIASYLADRQIDQIAIALRQVISRNPEDGEVTAIVAGTGSTLGEEAARRAGLDTVPLATLASGIRGAEWDRSAASAAVALLVAEAMGGIAPSLRGRH